MGLLVNLETTTRKLKQFLDMQRMKIRYIFLRALLTDLLFRLKEKEVLDGIGFSYRMDIKKHLPK